MVVFRPFRGWKYNPDVVGDLAEVVCPPYDLITPELQESLRRRNPYNVVHLEAGEGLDWTRLYGAGGGNLYRDTTALFEDWLGKQVLKRDGEPCFYLLRHDFTLALGPRLRGGDGGFEDQRRSRIGITGCVGLETYDSRQVFAHEYTEEPAVMDRVSLMSACNTNFSPIMSLYRDSDSILAPTLQSIMAGPPVIDIESDEDQRLSLWIVSERDAIERIQGFFDNTPVFLADGHHRYEASLRFQELQRQASQGSLPADDARNFVMMTLIEFDDPGLMVLPYHRVVKGMDGPALERFHEQLGQLFDSQTIELSGNNAAGELVEEVVRRSETGRVLGFIGPGPDASRLLTLKDGIDWRSWGHLATSEAWILEEKVLKPALGNDLSQQVNYVHDHEEAWEQVTSGECQAAFLVRPFPMAEFEEVVSQGQRLPRKSTFFYPKLPTGLVINQLDGVL